MNGRTASDLVCVIASGILLAMTAAAILQAQRASYEVNTGFFCAFMCLVPLIFRRAKILELPLTLVIMTEIAIFLHAYGVLLMRYDDVQVWDTVTHSISSITVSLCAFYTLMAVSVIDPMIKITRKWMPMLIVLVVIAFGAYWESFEFAVDELFGTNMQYSPWDTLRDLLCDVFGGTVVAVYSFFYLKNRSQKDFIEALKIHPKLRKIAKSRG
ncbi:MAG: hypothetical protein FWG96_03445 [Methanomassiliicoccaceae archaeon]|nr:hypothetical protein [Methanomassiliicoccaceae archaeon]